MNVSDNIVQSSTITGNDEGLLYAIVNNKQSIAVYQNFQWKILQSKKFPYEILRFH